MADEPELEATVDGGVPAEVEAGHGTCAVLQGSCSANGRRVRSVRLLLDGRPQPLGGRIARSSQPEGTKGWWALAELPATDEPRRVLVELEARVGWRRRRRALGTIRLLPAWTPPQPDYMAAAERADGSVTGAVPLRPKVAICIATRSPEIQQLRTLVKALRAQTHRNWLCIVCDVGSPRKHLERMRAVVGDAPRIELVRGERDDGLRGGLEQALKQVPPEAPYVVLADLDYDWQPATLGTMLSSLDAGSNAVLVGSGGDAPTPRPLDDDIESLLSGSDREYGPLLFRRQLLRYVVPFPPLAAGGGGPRRWVTLLARAVGGVTLLELPGDHREQPGDGIDRPSGDRSSDRLLWTVIPIRVLQARVDGYLTRRESRRLRRLGSRSGWRLRLSRGGTSAPAAGPG